METKSDEYECSCDFHSLKNVFEILKKESIRLIDGRYSKGFVNEADLKKLIISGQAEIYDNGGMNFVRLKGKK
jgi:hypothetical protein